MILRRDPRDEPRPEIPRHAFGRVGLDDALEVGEEEDADGGQHEFGRDCRQDEGLAAICVDGVCDQPGNQQVQGVSGHRQHDEAGDGAAVGEQQASQAGCPGRAALR